MKFCPGSTIGILGGGQLGKMISLSASYMGYKTHIYCPDSDSPAFQVTPNQTIASYSDTTALLSFAEQVDLITYEFENIPIETAHLLANKKTLFPHCDLLEASQHRHKEKKLLTTHQIPIATYYTISTLSDLKEAVAKAQKTCILKTTTLGYDGKGQKVILPTETSFDFWPSFAKTETLLEEFVPFTKELSIIVARNLSGDIKTFPLVENCHENGILKTTQAPALVAEDVKHAADRLAISFATSLNLVGLLTIELFLTENNQLIVNEIAPRPHNSGHWTIEGCETNQYEQLIRAICNLPLGSTSLKTAVIMHNLIGKEVEKWEALYQDDRVKVHLYGKNGVKEGRKMGHYSLLSSYNN